MEKGRTCPCALSILSNRLNYWADSRYGSVHVSAVSLYRNNRISAENVLVFNSRELGYFCILPDKYQLSEVKI
jgi:hypothetical protein